MQPENVELDYYSYTYIYNVYKDINNYSPLPHPGYLGAGLPLQEHKVWRGRSRPGGSLAEFCCTDTTMDTREIRAGLDWIKDNKSWFMGA